MRILPALFVCVLALCGAKRKPPVPVPVPVPTLAAPVRPIGLERVLGENERNLNDLFGKPDQDVHEPGARRLQYAGPFCILDAYLYAPNAGGEPVVTYVDARQPDGRDIDRASCVAATARRKQAR